MNFLFDNPISNMPIGIFLIFYAALILIIIASLYIRAKMNDKTTQIASQPIPSDPDPYEIAYLRGGINEVIRVAAFSLIEKKEIEIKDRIRPLPKPENQEPVNRGLSLLERDTLEWIRKNFPTPPELFDFEGLPGYLSAYSDDYQKRLQSKNLIHGKDTLRLSVNLRIIGILIIAAAGLYRIISAKSLGAAEVILLAIIGLGGSLALFYATRPKRLTSAGEEYLEKMRSAFNNLRFQIKYGGNQGRPEINAFPNQSAHLLAVGLFGTAILSGTEYWMVNSTFEKASKKDQAEGANSWSRCSAGCGAGCSVIWGPGSYSSGDASSSGDSGGSWSIGDSGSSCSGGGCGGGCGGGGD